MIGKDTSKLIYGISVIDETLLSLVTFRFRFPILVIKYAPKVDDPIGAIELIKKLKP